MALLLETTLGDLVVDLDVEGSPDLCRNVLKLAKARCYTNVLFYNVQPHRFCQTGDPIGDGSGGSCIYGLIEKDEHKRFLKSQGRVLKSHECREKGRVVATEMKGISDTIGSQFLITLEEGQDRALDGYRMSAEAGDSEASSTSKYLSLGVVTEDDQGVLDQIHNAYCDAQGRPYADIRIVRALVLHDPFEDPPGMEELLKQRGVITEDETVTASPNYPRPPEESVEVRINADQIDPEEDEEDEEAARARQEQIEKKEDHSRAVVLEMLGDLPSAEIKAPENVLFVCKLNPVTDDEDLELIFSRFDPNAKAEIIRDSETGASLQYAFVEFTEKQQCVEAYFKMNNALVDDRRIKVDFSQSVAKMWDKYAQRKRGGRPQVDSSNARPGAGRGRGGRSGGGGRGGGRGMPPRQSNGGPSRTYHPNQHRDINRRDHDEHRGREERRERDFHDRRHEDDRHHHQRPPADERYHDDRHRRNRSPDEETRHHHDRDRERGRHSGERDRDRGYREKDHRRSEDRRSRKHRSREEDRSRSRRDGEEGSHGHREREERKRDRYDDEERRRRRKHHRKRDRDDDRYSDDERRERKHRRHRRRSRSQSRSRSPDRRD